MAVSPGSQVITQCYRTGTQIRPGGSGAGDGPDAVIIMTTRLLYVPKVTLRLRKGLQRATTDMLSDGT